MTADMFELPTKFLSFEEWLQQRPGLFPFEMVVCPLNTPAVHNGKAEAE